MKACGETPPEPGAEVDEGTPEFRPSAFYWLMEREGASGALEAWAAAEAAAKEPGARALRRRANTEMPQHRVVQEVRRAFSDTWQFVQGNEAAQDLLAKLEGEAARAFAQPGELASTQWFLHWDDASKELQTEDGEPPADEMEVTGLNPVQRKVAHQLARALGLHSSSRGIGDKALSIRPPRRRCGSEGAWSAPFSVSRVLTA